MNKRNKIILIISIITTVIFLTVIILFKHFFSYSYIENEINKLTGLKVELINPKTTLNYKLDLNTKADEINIYDENKKNKFISINNPDISIKPLNLLFNKIYIKKLNANNIKIDIKRNENGIIDLQKSLKQDFLNSNNQNIKITKLNSEINNINLNFSDDYKIKNKISLILSNSNIKISSKHKSFLINQKGQIETEINSKKQIANLNLNINSLYPINNLNSDKLSFNIELNNINLFIFNDIFKKYISKDISTISGNINLSLKTNNLTQSEYNQNLVLDIINPELKLIDKKIITPYKKITTKLNFKADKNLIDINNLNVSSNELLINSKGNILNPFSKKPQFDFDTTITNTQLNNFLYFLPDNLIFYRPQGIPTLKKSNFHGIINGNIKTKLFPLDMTGNIKISNVHIPNYPKPYIQNDVNLMFMKDKMRVYTRVYTPDNEYVIVDGISNLDDSLYGKYNVKSTKNINLAFVQLYLVPIQQIIGFNIGPVPIMDIKGMGNIDIKTQGTIQDAQIFGVFNAKNATAQLKGLNAKLTQGNCQLIFDNRNLIFKEFKGNIDNAQFLLTGLGNTKGEVDLNIKIKNALTSKILKIFNNSEISKPYSAMTKNIAAVSGNLSGDINLKGTIINYEDEKFLQTLFPSGSFEFKNNKIILNNKLSIKKLSGILNFGQKQSGIFEFFINNSKFNFELNSNDSILKIAKGEDFNITTQLNSQKIEFQDILNEFKKAAFLNDNFKNALNNFNEINFYSKLNLKSNISLNVNQINIKNIKNYGYLIGLNSTNNQNIKFNSGLIKFDNNKIFFDNFNIDFNSGNIKAKGNILNYLTKNFNGDLNIDLSNINLETFDKLIPNIKLTNAILKSGQINLKGENLRLNSFNINHNSMPLVINANIKNIYDIDYFDANFSTILNDTTSDLLINPYLTYPVKIKGEMPLKANLKGNQENYSIDFVAAIPENSDISFSGANIGDIDTKREIAGKIDVNQNIAIFNNLKLSRFIKNQNNKINPITAIKINGKAIQKHNNIYYENFKIATQTPINVRILNLIFKKSILKKGNFECNLNLNGNIQTPKINGKIDLQDLDIPLYNTQIDNIKINITNNIIDGEIHAKNNNSDLKVFIKALNNLKPPYIINKLDIISNNFNIDDILSSIPNQNTKTDITQKQDITIKGEDIIIKNGNFDFKDITYNKISASNSKGHFSYDNNVFNLKNIIFDIAKGKVSANGTYNLNSTKLKLDASMKDCDANILAKEFLNLNNHIFGKMNGNIILNAKNLNTPDNIKNIKSEVNFTINEGKMPKLGSLEYLLRAGNLIKNGILGLSLNNLIEVLTPYRTGEFRQIAGNLSINKGIVENLEIKSRGENLSLYMQGKYSILDNETDINIYGKLSQNISNALGALGNASLKQFFEAISPKKDKERSIELQNNLDKIPPIDFENIDTKYFKVKIYGDINKDNYNKKFNWE